MSYDDCAFSRTYIVLLTKSCSYFVLLSEEHRNSLQLKRQKMQILSRSERYPEESCEIQRIAIRSQNELHYVSAKELSQKFMLLLIRS